MPTWVTHLRRVFDRPLEAAQVGEIVDVAVEACLDIADDRTVPAHERLRAAEILIAYARNPVPRPAATPPEKSE